MDAKITLSFNEEVIAQAKKFAESQNISLSRLTEFLYRQMTSKSYRSMEDFPVADWVNTIAEGEAVYKTKPSGRKSLKREYFKSRK
jgi:hypothetical protein